MGIREHGYAPYNNNNNNTIRINDDNNNFDIFREERALRYFNIILETQFDSDKTTVRFQQLRVE